MSFILDALKKSENERTLGQTPSIHRAPEGPHRRPRQRALWLLLLAVLVLGGAGYLGWLLWAGETGADPEMPVVAATTGEQQPNVTDQAGNQPPPAAQSEAPTARSHPAARAEPSLPSQPLAAAEAGDASANDSARPSMPWPETAEPNAPATLGSGADPANTVVTGGAGDEQNSAESTSAAAAPERDIRAERLAAERAARELAAAEQAEADTAADAAADSEPEAQADWRPADPETLSYFDLPANVRRDFPELKISIMVYSPDPEKRFVIVAGERYAEGDELSDGVTLVGIRQNSLLLDYQGYRFDYRK